MLKAHYEGKLRENKENPTARIILARIYWDERDYQKSAEMYEALGKAESDNVRYFYYAAAALSKNRQPDLAKEMLNQAAKALASCSKKDDVWFLGALATICIENRMYEPAIELSKSAIDKSDGDPDSRLQDTLRALYLQKVTVRQNNTLKLLICIRKWQAKPEVTAHEIWQKEQCVRSPENENSMKNGYRNN